MYTRITKLSPCPRACPRAPRSKLQILCVVIMHNTCGTIASTLLYGPVIEMRAVLWFFDDSCTFPRSRTSVRDANEGPPSVSGHFQHDLLKCSSCTGHAVSSGSHRTPPLRLSGQRKVTRAPLGRSLLQAKEACQQIRLSVDT